MNICEIIKEYCNDRDLSFRDDYSGRGMYGERCIGFTVSGNILDELTDLLSYVFQMVTADDEFYEVGDDLDIREVLGGSIEYDSMGFNTIIYFPNLKYSEKDNE